ncbi:MAG: C2H2-type zinc finger protein [Vulcanisaeta sp.]|jgi:hypothetical protein|nr:C2H2-type zinc finger protein [Vulcanisaeta sp.]MCG2870295.1 C2H2-type zinc finger protein [Vulcanisaeta sp.]MCG2887516.1 C2H2-type zinc finger protein [Vulcanisaeta sp.]
MVICPVCGKEYASSSSLLKHVKLKSRYDPMHMAFWLEFQKFISVPREEWASLTKTDLFREFLRERGLL